MPADAIAGLRATRLFSCVPDDDLLAVVEASRLRSFRRGQVVFSTGDPGDSYVAVLEGLVKVVVRSADGGELILTVVPAGGSLGELSVADGGDRSADAETVTDTTLLFVPREVVLDVCARLPAAGAVLLQSVAGSLRRLTEATSDLVFLDLPRRVAKAVLDHPRDADGLVVWTLTQEQLAHRVGGTRQSVNAALRGFQRRGWIELRDRALLVKDPAALTRFASS